MSEPKQGKIYQSIPKLMGEIQAVGKEGQNQQQGYKFRKVDDVYLELHLKLAANGVFTTTEVLESTREMRETRNGGVLTYSLMKIRFTFWADDGSSVECVMIGEGSDAGDKSSNKAMSVAHKYAFCQVFAIPTADDKDPENGDPEFSKKKKSTPRAEAETKVDPADTPEARKKKQEEAKAAALAKAGKPAAPADSAPTPTQAQGESPAKSAAQSKSARPELKAEKHHTAMWAHATNLGLNVPYVKNVMKRLFPLVKSSKELTPGMCKLLEKELTALTSKEPGPEEAARLAELERQEAEQARG